MKRGIWTICVVAALDFLLGAPVAEAGGIVFKKAKPGSSTKRIDVQITPEEDWYKRTHREKMERAAKVEAGQTVQQDAAEAAASSGAKPAGDLQDWFWTANSPLIKDAAFDRMENAVLTLARHPAQAARISPRISTYQKLAEMYGSDILLATLGKEVSPALVLAVIGVESSGKVDAESSAGAIGLMQLMDATAERFGVSDRTDPKQSIKGGAQYLAWLLKEFKGDPLLALAGYNAGENAVKKHDGVPPYPETRAYVPKVIAAWQVARSLCMTQPKYPTDGCVFKARVGQ